MTKGQRRSIQRRRVRTALKTALRQGNYFSHGVCNPQRYSWGCGISSGMLKERTR